MKTNNNPIENPLLETWEQIGKNNLWIAEAYDPPFDKSMLTECHSLEDLQSRFIVRNWCLGQGYYYKNLCFINQVDGGDEWLTIKEDYAFESISFKRIIDAGEFMEMMHRLLEATKEQCLRLTY